jgi:hypothetical protein
MRLYQLTLALALASLSGCCCTRPCPGDSVPVEVVPTAPGPAVLPPSPALPDAPVPAQPVPAAPVSQRLTRVAEGPY